MATHESVKMIKSTAPVVVAFLVSISVTSFHSQSPFPA